jgi:hypothetical protein
MPASTYAGAAFDRTVQQPHACESLVRLGILAMDSLPLNKPGGWWAPEEDGTPSRTVCSARWKVIDSIAGAVHADEVEEYGIRWIAVSLGLGSVPTWQVTVGRRLDWRRSRRLSTRRRRTGA